LEHRAPTITSARRGNYACFGFLTPPGITEDPWHRRPPTAEEEDAGRLEYMGRVRWQVLQFVAPSRRISFRPHWASTGICTARRHLGQVVVEEQQTAGCHRCGRMEPEFVFRPITRQEKHIRLDQGRSVLYTATARAGMASRTRPRKLRGISGSSACLGS
jgi:hypothetical protein